MARTALRAWLSNGFGFALARSDRVASAILFVLDGASFFWSSGLTGSVRLGQKAKAKGLFLIPEETAPPLDPDLEGPFLAARNPFFLQPAYASDYGLLQATLDPYVHAVHVSLLRQRDQPPDKVKEHSEELSRKLLTQGPSALSPEEKIALLWNADALIGIHKELWISPTDRLHDWWLQALRNYNESVAILVRRSVT